MFHTLPHKLPAPVITRTTRDGARFSVLTVRPCNTCFGKGCIACEFVGGRTIGLKAAPSIDYRAFSRNINAAYLNGTYGT